MGVIKGDTRSSDYSYHGVDLLIVRYPVSV